MPHFFHSIIRLVAMVASVWIGVWLLVNARKIFEEAKADPRAANWRKRPGYLILGRITAITFIVMGLVGTWIMITKGFRH